MQTTLVMHGLAVTPHSHNPVPVPGQVVKDQAANIASAAREEDEVRSEEPELNVKPSSDEEETTTTIITTTTIVTTMQSPGKYTT